MFRKQQVIATCFAIIGLGPAGVAALAPSRDGTEVEVSDLRPFTHSAYIPMGADLSSIKMESIRAVKVASRLRTVISQRYCEQRLIEPGGSMYCPQTTEESPVQAYKVSYSFKGQPMASDEYGTHNFTFSVYFRPDELDPGLLRALSSGSISRTDAAEFFQVTTSRDSVRQTVIDEANSHLCDGNYVDGNWTHTDPKCAETVAYKVIASPSTYITVTVEPTSSHERSSVRRSSGLATLGNDGVADERGNHDERGDQHQACHAAYFRGDLLPIWAQKPSGNDITATPRNRRDYDRGYEDAWPD